LKYSCVRQPEGCSFEIPFYRSAAVRQVPWFEYANVNSCWQSYPEQQIRVTYIAVIQLITNNDLDLKRIKYI